MSRFTTKFTVLIQHKCLSQGGQTFPWDGTESSQIGSHLNGHLVYSKGTNIFIEERLVFSINDAEVCEPIWKKKKS